MMFIWYIVVKILGYEKGNPQFTLYTQLKIFK